MFDYNKMDLSGVEASSGTLRLGKGVYEVTCKSAEAKTTQKGGNSIVLELIDPSSGKTIKDFINVNVPSSPEATMIGLARYKSFLTHAGHPNPDHPGSPQSCVGLQVRIDVVEDEYIDQKGKTRKGSKVNAYLAKTMATQASSASMDDEIPF